MKTEATTTSKYEERRQLVHINVHAEIGWHQTMIAEALLAVKGKDSSTTGS